MRSNIGSLRSNIGIALLAALAGGGILSPMNNIMAPGETMFRRDFSRSRWGTRSNRRYVHKRRLMTEQRMGWHGRVEVAGQYWEANAIMRKAERKGVPGVPRGFGDKNAIRF